MIGRPVRGVVGGWVAALLAFRPDGSFRKVIGIPGHALPGRLHYPTDLEWSDGRIYVVDFGNHRIQVFEALPSVLP